MTQETSPIVPSSLVPGRIKVVHAALAASAAARSQYPPPGPAEVAVLGRSNVGKSSLLNFLTGVSRLARVSNTPGRTRLVNYFRVELHAAAQRRVLHLVDLPGYGFARMSHADRARTSRMLGEYLESDRPLAAALLLMDIRRDPSEDDRQALAALQGAGRPTLTVITKADKVVKSQRKPRAAAIARALRLQPTDVIVTSAHESLGRTELLELLWTLAQPPGGGRP